MNEFLASPLFRNLAIAAAVLVVGGFLWRRLFPARVLTVALRVRCPLCGWSGTVGKYNRRCSKCGSTTLEEIRRGS